MSGNEEPAAVDWLVGSGEMGKLIRSMDWSKTPLGPIESWSQSLRTTVSLCLASNFPISIAWGQERVLIYNDGYWPICGEKHPHSMGQDFKECWLSAWDAIGESFERASAGQSAFLQNQRMFVDRNGYLEEAFFTFSFSPIRDETGGVGGVFHPLTEQTQQTLAERRLKVLRDLADRTAEANTIEQACGSMTQALAAHELDLPFTLFYRLDTEGKHARLIGNTGLEPGSAACPTVVDLEASPDGWALAEVARAGLAQQVDELEERFGSLACGPYPESPKSALVMPISLLGLEHPLGLFVAGVSPRRALDEAYQTFYKMLGESVTSALANASAYEEERKRAEALAELDRAKTTFFSNVSHEFRTPLTLMLGPLDETLSRLDRQLPASERSQLQRVQRNEQRLLKLVNTLLDFSRIEAGRIAETVALVEGGQSLPSVRTENISSAQILLVDDNTDMRDYVRRLLLDQGYAVEIAADGMAALAAVGQQAPDLVLTDVVMPRLDGFGLLRELRADPTTRDIPIILLSARAGEEARIEGLEAGADDYLAKPFSARELLARVEANLKLAWLRQEAMQPEQGLRQEAETARQEVETILSSINDSFFVLDRNWRYTYVNDHNCELIGMKREELLGQSIWNLFPDVVGTEVYGQFQRVMTEQTLTQFEYFYPTWRRWFEYRVYPSLDGITVFVTEITDRKRAEAALRESEQRYRTLFETMDQGFCVCEMLFDENGKPTDYRFLEVNPVFETMTGLEQATGKTARELVPNLEAHWVEIYGRVVLTGEPVRFENQSEAMNSWFDASAFRVGEPQSHKFAILFTNITDRKQVEMALRESEERFRSMADNAPFMVWVTDSTGYCTYLSQSWYDFTGQTEESGLGLGWLNATHPDDRQYAERSFLEANERKGAFRVEYRLRRKNGEYIWAIDAANPWFGVDGQYKGYIGSVIDISDRKQAETERDRLLQLEQTARAEAEKANRIKDEFLAVLSHELRTPLNPILGWSKLLQNGKLDQAKTKQALTTIERNAKLQSELIEDLLDVSRILQGKLNLNVSPVNLASTIRAAIETVRLAAEAKSIAVIANLDTEVGQVSGDTSRLQQVVWNLLSNAVKFTPAGGQVTVRLEQVENQAHITVSDTGKGIHPDFVPYMFDYFRQEDGATTRGFGGLGLGLAIVRHLVELHGGTVQADSSGVGLGATFTVKLPLMPIQPAVNLDRPSSEPSLDLNGFQVLVIDDETDSREFVAFVLEQAGARVTTATSAGEGFAALTQSQPDVLLSDIGMPDMDGYMLIRQIRALPPEQGGQVPAIALTAYAGDFNQQQALAAGFQRHLAKPIDPGELLVIIASLVKVRGKLG